MSGRRSPVRRQSSTGSRRSVLGSAVEQTRRAAKQSIDSIWVKLGEESPEVNGAEELHPTLRLAARLECLRVIVHASTPRAWPHDHAIRPVPVTAPEPLTVWCLPMSCSRACLGFGSGCGSELWSGLGQP